MGLKAVVLCSVGLLAGCQGGLTPTAATTGPATFAAIAVVNQLPLDSALHGHNMAVSGCMGYVSLQSNLLPSKLARVNLCGASGTSYSAAPVLVDETAGSYPVMNGITVNGSQLYVTYAWATNPFEVWDAGSQTSAPKVLGCVSLFTVAGYAGCGAAASGYGSLLGSNPFVVGSDVYVAENSDDAGQAVQVVDVTSPQAPVRLNTGSQGVTAGKSSGGAMLAGIWAAGSGKTLYVATVDDVQVTDQPVTITAYDTSANAVSPVQVGKALNVPEGFAVQSLAVTGTTVVATLFDAATQASQVMVASFANPAAPSSAAVAATQGCGFESQNFIALQGSYALMGCGMGTGIEVVDFSSQSAPVVKGEMATTLNGVGFISPQGRYLYAVDQDGKLDTVDVGTVLE